MWTKASMTRRAVSGAFVAAFALSASSAGAAVVSDQSGAILVFPKVVVDTNGDLGPRQDTWIQLTNTSNSVISARCFYVNATGHCSNNPAVACTDATVASDCGSDARCVPQWAKRDFRMTLTKRQPLAWRASDGLPDLPCDGIGSPDGGCPFGQSNVGADGSVSSIPPVQEDPFYGELRCVQVDPETFEPSAGFNPGNLGRGDLKGEATVVSFDGSDIDARKYNAVAIQSTTANNRDDTLLIGGPTPEYSACPAALTLNHLFDNANVGYGAGAGSSNVTTDLTFVPCSQDYLNEATNRLVLQFLIFNEFEQRFSASTNVDCWREVQLSDIDTRPGPAGNATSIFSVNVQGTLAGQTRIRPVASNGLGNGILSISEERWTSVSGGLTRSTASNVHSTGATAIGDRMILSPDSFNP